MNQPRTLLRSTREQGARIPRGIWVLGFVSMLMDISSEMIHSLLPLFMVTTPGASALAVGAFVGPLIAVGLMLLWANDFQAVFTLARFSEAFLVLRAQQGGVPIALVPLVMVAMNVVYAISAYPFGKLSDRMSHTALLALGLGVLIAADLVLAAGDSLGFVLAGVALWGVHMGITQGLLARMVADSAPADLRGTAFGFFNLVSGLALLLASVLAGLLWDRLGAAATFQAGAALCIAALCTLWARPYQQV